MPIHDHLHLTPALIALIGIFVLWAVLFVLAEFGDVSLKPLKSWIAAATWLLWGITALPSLLKYSATLACRAFGSLRGSHVSRLAWVKRRYLFESSVKPSRSMAPWLTVSAANL